MNLMGPDASNITSVKHVPRREVLSSHVPKGSHPPISPILILMIRHNKEVDFWLSGKSRDCRASNMLDFHHMRCEHPLHASLFSIEQAWPSIIVRSNFTGQRHCNHPQSVGDYCVLASSYRLLLSRIGRRSCPDAVIYTNQLTTVFLLRATLSGRVPRRLHQSRRVHGGWIVELTRRGIEYGGQHRDQR